MGFVRRTRQILLALRLAPWSITSGTLILFSNFIECNGILTGEFNAFLSQHLPQVLAGQFNTIVDDAAAADAVIINFADEYQPEYRTLAAFVSSEIGIFDEFEDFQSCGDAEYCFVRLGIDADLPVSEEFNTPTPIVSPTTPPPSTTPPTTGPTPPPSGNNRWWKLRDCRQPGSARNSVC